MSGKLYAITLPILFLAVFQLSGCVNTRTGTIPPGGTYISTSAGANFDQSVNLMGEDGGNIARFPLKRAHRPLHNSNLIYVAAGNEGIIRSKNGGANWEVITTPLAQVIDVALLANGTIVATGLDGEGRGFIIRSLNNADTWEVVLTVPIPVNTQQFQIIKNESINSVILTIQVDPFNPDRLYAGSNLGALLIGEQSGKTWRTVHTVEASRFDPTGNRQNLGVRDLIPSPHTPGEVLVITFDRALHRVIDDQQEEVKIPLYIDTPPPFGSSGTQTRKVLDASFVAGAPGTLIAASVEGVIISRDNGGTWKTLSVPIETTDRKGFNGAVVTASPTNPNRLFVSVNSVFYRSEDGGNSWNTFDFNLPNHLITAILIDPTNAANVLTVTSLLGT